MFMKQQQPKIAIITTIYNDYDVVKKLLKALLEQTSNNFIHYIYDDGSSSIDNKLITEYIDCAKKRNKPYKVIFIKGAINIGCQKAHEYMFRYIKEDYFSWVDSDDSVTKNFVKVICKHIKKHPETTVFHLNSIIYYDSEYKVRKKHSTGFYYSQKELRKKDQLLNYCFNSESKFYHEFVIKKADLLKINPNLTIFCDDHFQTNWYDAQLMFQLALGG